MNFWLFCLYYFICSLILGLVLLLIYHLFIKKKCFDVSKLAEKTIEDYFNAYDLNDIVDEIDYNEKR